MQANSTTTTAATVYDAAYALRNELLANLDTRECAGALTFLLTTWAALTAAQARREAARFASIARAELFDALLDAVDYARSVAPIGPWSRAVETAYGYLLDAEVLSYDAAAHALRVESASRPGTFYTANGSCQCEAFTRGTGVCWHRAAARLVARALELRAQPAPAAQPLGARIAAARTAQAA